MDPVNINFTAGGKLPGEDLLVSILTFVTKNRETMSQENRDKYDAIQVAMLKGWHNWWVTNGWPGEKV